MSKIQDIPDSYWPKNKLLRRRLSTIEDVEKWHAGEPVKFLYYGMPGWEDAVYEQVFIINPKVIHE